MTTPEKNSPEAIAEALQGATADNLQSALDQATAAGYFPPDAGSCQPGMVQHLTGLGLPTIAFSLNVTGDNEVSVLPD